MFTINFDGLALFIFAVMGGLVLYVLTRVTTYIFFLLSMQKALNQVSPRNRKMTPALVWLNMIPWFDLVWQFMIAIRVSDAIRDEFYERGYDDGTDYGKTLGLTYCIICVIAFGVYLISSYFGSMIGMGSSYVVSLLNAPIGIVFWVKIARYRKQLANQDIDHPAPASPPG